MGGPLIHIAYIGLASSLDNLGVGVAYGARRIRITPLANCIIAAIAFAFTLVTSWLGGFTGRLISGEVANLVGAAIFVLMGVALLAPLLRHPCPHGVEMAGGDAGCTSSPPMRLRDAVVLGVALSANCLSSGFAAGLLNFGPVLTALVATLFSYLSVWIGVQIGSRCAADRLGGNAAVVAGLLLIVMGVGQFI